MPEMLGKIGLCWSTSCIGASLWPCNARLYGKWPIDDRIQVPTGYCEFWREICDRRARQATASSTSDAGA
jgi:hypothetical protein